MAKRKVLGGSQCPHCGTGIAYKIQVGNEIYWQCKGCKMTFQDKEQHKYNYEESFNVEIFTIKE